MPPEPSSPLGAPRWWLVVVLSICALTGTGLVVASGSGAPVPGEGTIWWAATAITWAGLLGLISFQALAPILTRLLKITDKST